MKDGTDAGDGSDGEDALSSTMAKSVAQALVIVQRMARHSGDERRFLMEVAVRLAALATEGEVTLTKDAGPHGTLDAMLAVIDSRFAATNARLDWLLAQKL